MAVSTDLVTELAATATRGGEQLEGASPQDVLGWALEQWHPTLVIVPSATDPAERTAEAG